MLKSVANNLQNPQHYIPNKKKILKMDEKELNLALHSLKQGNFLQARRLLEKLLKQGNLSVKRDYDTAKEQLLRRYWRQGKVGELIRESEGSPLLSLAIARLSGREALQKIAEGSHLEANLAKFSLEPSLKTALLQMRQLSGWKDLSEGWLSLMKKDLPKARESFEAALPDHPIRGKIALSIVDALEGRMNHTGFLKSATHRFPHFSKIMGITKEDSKTLLSKELIYSQFRMGSFENLEKLFLQLTPSQKEEKGWICLRLGDLEYVEGKKRQRAEFYWQKAENFHPILKTDRLKREFIVAHLEKDRSSCNRLFLEYFHALYRKDQKRGLAFLKEILTGTFPGFYAEFPIPFFSDSQDKWLVSEVPAEVALFGGARTSARFAGFPALRLSPKTLSSFSISKVVCEEFHKVESVFSGSDFYLKIKIQLNWMLEDHKKRREALARLIEIQPLALVEKLPEYIEAVFRTKEDVFMLKEEIKKLSFLYPARYDLARLQFLIDDEIPGYTSFFSPSLLSVLQLQVHLDKKDKSPSNYFDQALSLYGKDQEADWRFWHALATVETSSAFFRKLKKAFKENLLDKNLAENIFIQIMKYQETGFSEELLRYWIKKDRKSWIPYFIFAMECAESGEPTEALYCLRKAASTIPKSHSLIGRIGMLHRFLVYGEV